MAENLSLEGSLASYIPQKDRERLSLKGDPERIPNRHVVDIIKKSKNKLVDFDYKDGSRVNEHTYLADVQIPFDMLATRRSVQPHPRWLIEQVGRNSFGADE